MIICTKCGQQADRGETFCRRCGAFLEWAGQPAASSDEPPPVVPTAAPARRADVEPEIAGPHVMATLSATSTKVDPGGQVAVTVEVTNRGRTVDQVTLEVLGPPAAWSSVDRPTLNLMPDTSAEATIRFSPPRTSRVRSGPNPADIAVRSHEHPDASVVERIEVVVAPFVEFETNLAPSVLRGSQAATTTLRASNSGNAPVELSLSAEDPEMAFEFGISPSTLRVEPGATADASVVVTPREALRSGTDRTRPFRVLAASGDGARRSLDGTFIQVVTRRPRWRLAFALLGLLGIVIVGIGLVDLLRGGGGGDGATPTPATPSTEVSPSTGISPAALPDLQIAAVETFPQEPSAGKRFTLNVYITNRGQAPSGDYDLWMTIVDVNRGNKYPIGTFREASMQPGEQVAAFTTQDAMVNEPGPFEVRVGIDPFLFEDGDPGNNTMVHTFNVLPRP